MDEMGSIHVSVFDRVSLYVSSKITCLRQKHYYYYTCMIGNPYILG